MKHTYQIVVKNGNMFFIQGSIKQKNPELTSPAVFLDNLNYCMEQIEKFYDSGISNDEKIIGQEKATLVNLLESVLIEIIALSFHFIKKAHNSYIRKVDYTADGYSFDMYKEDFGFTISGKYSQKTYSEIQDFHGWYKGFFTKSYTDVLTNLRQSLKDAVIDKSEMAVILDNLGKILHGCIIMHYKLEAGYLDR